MLHSIVNFAIRWIILEEFVHVFDRYNSTKWIYERAISFALLYTYVSKEKEKIE